MSSRKLGRDARNGKFLPIETANRRSRDVDESNGDASRIASAATSDAPDSSR
jgi:hypothetical protein